MYIVYIIYYISTLSNLKSLTLFLQGSQCNYNINIEERSRNHCFCGKAKSITSSECVFVDLGTQHKTQMHDIAISVRPF